MSGSARRTIVGLATASLAAGALTVSAASAREDSGDDVLKTFETVVAQGLTGFDTRTGKSLDLSPIRLVTNLIDASTGDVLGKGPTRLRISAHGPADDARSCIRSGNRKGLRAYDPINRHIAGNKGTIQFQYHAYRLQNARRVGGGQTTQWEVCSKGGGSLGGARLQQVGTGMALNNPGETRRIGYAWQAGKTPEDYSLELGFQVEKGPVSIGASLTQHPSDKLLGGFRGPFESFMDAHEFNGVNAWWQDNCIGRWYGCLRNSGSHDFQGALAHGLWEFPQGKEPAIVSFYLTPYARF